MIKAALIWIDLPLEAFGRSQRLTELKNNNFTLALFLLFIFTEVCNGMQRFHMELRHTKFIQTSALFYLKQKDMLKLDSMLKSMILKRNREEGS